MDILIKVIPQISLNLLHFDDTEMQGEYAIYVREEATPEQVADIALDVFHNNVPIAVLEDFSFEVWKDGKQLTPNPDHDSYSFSHLGSM